MSKKNKLFVNHLKKKENLPLNIYLLEQNNSRAKGIMKASKSIQLNTEGYILGGFYKPISKY